MPRPAEPGRKEDGKMEIYADGFGRWHAVAEDTPLALAKAIDGMADAILERSPRGTTRKSVADYIHQNIVSVPPCTPGGVHFAEYALDNPGKEQ